MLPNRTNLRHTSVPVYLPFFHSTRSLFAKMNRVHSVLVACPVHIGFSMITSPPLTKDIKAIPMKTVGRAVVKVDNIG
jgi:hypothetical protein